MLLQKNTKKVQQRHHRQQRPQQAAGKQAGQHRQGKERGIHPGQPLDFTGMMKNSKTRMSGYSMAKAKNMERFT